MNYRDLEVVEIIVFCDEFYQGLRAEKSDLEQKLNTVLYDVNYEGGLQYWMKKHSDLLLTSVETAQKLAAAMENVARLEQLQSNTELNVEALEVVTAELKSERDDLARQLEEAKEKIIYRKRRPFPAKGGEA